MYLIVAFNVINVSYGLFMYVNASKSMYMFQEIKKFLNVNMTTNIFKKDIYPEYFLKEVHVYAIKRVKI